MIAISTEMALYDEAQIQVIQDTWALNVIASQMNAGNCVYGNDGSMPVLPSGGGDCASYDYVIEESDNYGPWYVIGSGTSEVCD